MMECRDLFQTVRAKRPLIHCITGYVTANDVANMILAAGASPVMADGVQEVEEITAHSQALVLNLGTLRETAVESMVLAGKTAVRLGHPVILDPVGAGGSAFRRQTALRMIKEISCAVIRGNGSELKALVYGESDGRGVDAEGRDCLTEENQKQMEQMVTKLSQDTGAIVVMTGHQDLISDGKQIYRIRNGHPMMAQITGSGCMLDGVIGALAAAPESELPLFWRVAYGVAAMGICGEQAYEKTIQTDGGTGSFRMYLIDAMSNMEDEQVRKGVRLEF